MSLLNPAQRQQLDAALSLKASEAKQEAKQKGMVANPLGERKGRSIRQPGNQGQDGKFQWGSMFLNTDAFDGVVDRGDPNYSDSEVDATEHRESMLMDMRQDILKSEAEQVKASILTLVTEYFSSLNMSEVVISLEDLGCEMHYIYFVKRLILLALDRKDRERERASALLNSLYSVVIPSEAMVKGFESIIDCLEDTTLDVPDAPNLMALFIARAICDDILPPSFASRISDSMSESSSSIVLLKSKVEQLLSGQHSKILECWGPAGSGSAQDAKDSIALSLREYAASHDMGKVFSCLQALSLPFFHHEAVKQAVYLAMSSPPQREATIGLLKHLVFDALQISQGQFMKGLQRVSSSLPDLALDDPSCAEEFGRVMDDCVAAGLLDEEQRIFVSTQTDTAPTSAHSLSQFKLLTAATIREYFSAADPGEVVRRLQELNDPGLLHLVVKQMIVMANEKKDSQREMTSSLLLHLSAAGALSHDQFILGFIVLLSDLEDHILDCPDAARLAALFLARSIADGVLSASALSQILLGLPASCGLGIQVVRSAGALLSDKRVRLNGCWRSGSLESSALQLEPPEVSK